MNQTVKTTLETGRCLGCGTCVGVCPHGVLTLQFTKNGELQTSFSKPDVCTECGLCWQVCRAGYELFVDNPLLQSGSIAKFKSEMKDETVYAVHSSNSKRRKASASGGFVTEFLLYLFENNCIDSAIEVRRSEKNPLLGGAVLVRNQFEVEQSRCSVYSPVDYSTAIEYVKTADECQRFAIVGLPCQLAYLRAWLNKNPKHRAKVSFLISLVCGHTPTLNAYDYLLKKANVLKDDLVTISNRGNGWPGYLSIVTKNGDSWSTTYGGWLSWGMLLSSPLMMSKGCLCCVDPCGFAADVSVSDAWLPEYRTADNQGENLVWIHNESVKSIFEHMNQDGRFISKPETFARFVDANKNVFVKKTYMASVAERVFIRRESRNNRLNAYYGRLSLTQRLKLRLLFRTVRLYRRFSKVIPVSKPFLFYTKVLSWLSKRNILKNEKYIDRSGL
ncbi:MAG: Coenzyme F420 hydrogenase/dehydrogenase, beta subunit C-terminal domain [Eubacteriaceae bacterium]|nr:Coenzyme F420 hydrogenase/dehydrogenase, beta subunit C-terminal domain [Eubacteriaceae bacterium]